MSTILGMYNLHSLVLLTFVEICSPHKYCWFSEIGNRYTRMHWKLRPRLVDWFNMFSIFKQHYTHFHTLFYPYVFQKNINNVTKRPLSHTKPNKIARLGATPNQTRLPDSVPVMLVTNQNSSKPRINIYLLIFYGKYYGPRYLF